MQVHDFVITLTGLIGLVPVAHKGQVDELQLLFVDATRPAQHDGMHSHDEHIPAVYYRSDQGRATAADGRLMSPAGSLLWNEDELDDRCAAKIASWDKQTVDWLRLNDTLISISAGDDKLLRGLERLSSVAALLRAGRDEDAGDVNPRCLLSSGEPALDRGCRKRAVFSSTLYPRVTARAQLQRGEISTDVAECNDSDRWYPRWWFARARETKLANFRHAGRVAEEVFVRLRGSSLTITATKADKSAWTLTIPGERGKTRRVDFKNIPLTALTNPKPTPLVNDHFAWFYEVQRDRQRKRRVLHLARPKKNDLTPDEDKARRSKANPRCPLGLFETVTQD
jgi:hypothetical protein